MRNVLFLVLIAGLLVTLSSCFDPQPGEISIIATKNGKPQGCGVQVFNTKDKQISQKTTDMSGMCYISGMKPGTYTLRFVDSKGKRYPAERKIILKEGDSQQVRVELTEAPPVVDE